MAEVGPPHPHADNADEQSVQAHVVRQGLLQQSHMVFSSNAKTINWCLGRDPYKEGEARFVDEFKSLKPCIHGSDAHSLEEIGVPCALRGDSSHECSDEASPCELQHCWIKADCTFEGLKQVLFEPADRVRISMPAPRERVQDRGRQLPPAGCEEEHAAAQEDGDARLTTTTPVHDRARQTALRKSPPMGGAFRASKPFRQREDMGAPPP